MSTIAVSDVGVFHFLGLNVNDLIYFKCFSNARYILSLKFTWNTTIWKWPWDNSLL